MFGSFRAINGSLYQDNKEMCIKGILRKEGETVSHSVHYTPSLKIRDGEGG